MISESLPRAALAGKDVVLCARPAVDAKRAQVLGALRGQGLRLVADFDDLLFDCDPDDYPPIARGTRQRAVHELRLREYRQSLDHFDAFTVSTDSLAEHLRALRPGAPVHVVPNGVSPGWLRQGLMLYRTWRPGDPKVIRYLPGSPTHDRDFAVIANPLRGFLREHGNVRLEVVGPLSFDGSGFPQDRVARRARVPFERFAELLGSSWVTLAPLARSEFNRCKSAIKFLEAAAFACPTVATPIPDILRHRDGGVLRADTEEDWYRALTDLLPDDRRLALGLQAQKYVFSQGMADVSVQALDAALRNWGVPG